MIDAFDQDIPFDEFITKQLAGDLLPALDETERAHNLIATGYLAVGAKGHNTRSRREFQADLIDEQIDAFSQGILGITVACAMSRSQIRPDSASRLLRRQGDL